jgi:hypothetical protein
VFARARRSDQEQDLPRLEAIGHVARALSIPIHRSISMVQPTRPNRSDTTNRDGETNPREPSSALPKKRDGDTAGDVRPNPTDPQRTSPAEPKMPRFDDRPASTSGGSERSEPARQPEPKPSTPGYGDQETSDPRRLDTESGARRQTTAERDIETRRKDAERRATKNDAQTEVNEVEDDPSADLN